MHYTPLLWPARLCGYLPVEDIFFTLYQPYYFLNFLMTIFTLTEYSVAFKFGIISMFSGLIGVPTGSFIAQRLRPRYKRIDAHICAVGLLTSAPFVFLACIFANVSGALCFTMVFFAELALNLTWSIVADILLVRKKKIWTLWRKRRALLTNLIIVSTGRYTGWKSQEGFIYNPINSTFHLAGFLITISFQI